MILQNRVNELTPENGKKLNWSEKTDDPSLPSHRCNSRFIRCSCPISQLSCTAAAIGQRGKLDNFNLAADYLLFHELALIAVAILCHLFPERKYHQAGWAFQLGSILFQGSVLIKSFVSIQPFGFVTPLGGFILMTRWGLLFVAALSSYYAAK